MYQFPLPFQPPDLYSVESDVKPQINKSKRKAQSPYEVRVDKIDLTSPKVVTQKSRRIKKKDSKDSYNRNFELGFKFRTVKIVIMHFEWLPSYFIHGWGDTKSKLVFNVSI